jgi:mycothiol synthase
MDRVVNSFLPVPLEQRLSRPGYSPQDDLFLAEREGHIVAYLDTFRELAIGRVVFEAAALPGLRRRWVASLLLQQAMEHATAIGAGAMHFPISGADRVARRLLEGHGFSPVRRFLHLSLRRRRVAAVPARPPLRPMGPGEEAELTRIQNLSFAGSWGFQPNTEEGISYRLGLDCCSPAGVFFAVIDERVVGYCWTRDLRGKGEIWMIGVDPACRGQGVGRALLLRGIHHLRQRGFHRVDLTVDEENSGAIALYRSVGFRQTGTVVWYERRL